MGVSQTAEQTVVFVCHHGAFRSRIAAAYFNAVAPAGWSAVSAGVKPQSEVSPRLGPVLVGSGAELFADTSPPRPLDAVTGTRTIAIDADVPGAETWHMGGDSLSDDQIGEHIRARVHHLVEMLTGPSTDSGL